MYKTSESNTWLLVCMIRLHSESNPGHKLPNSIKQVTKNRIFFLKKSHSFTVIGKMLCIRTRDQTHCSSFVWFGYIQEAIPSTSSRTHPQLTENKNYWAKKLFWEAVFLLNFRASIQLWCSRFRTVPWRVTSRYILQHKYQNNKAVRTETKSDKDFLALKVLD